MIDRIQTVERRDRRAGRGGHGSLWRRASAAIGRNRPTLDTGLDAGCRYDAFISYKRGTDKELAKSLQQGLHQFDKPWNRVRALWVFRDESSLGVNPRLWDPIERAMDSSRYFILLASPGSAASDGVKHEVRYWLDYRPHDRFLIGLTDGELAWNPGGGVAATTTALHPDFFAEFPVEAGFVDLRCIRDAGDLDLRNPRFLDAVATFASELRDTPKENLLSDDVRQHRKTRRLRNGALVGLSVLLVLAVVFGALALIASDTAVTQRDIAQSRALAIEADQMRSIDPAVARQLSVEAYDISPTVEARGSLLSTSSLPPVTRMFDHDGPTLALSTSRDGSLIATAGFDGKVGLWSGADPGSPTLLATIAATEYAATSVAVSPDGSTLAVGTQEGSVGVWSIADPRTPQRVAQIERAGGARFDALAFGPTGKLLAGGDADGKVFLWSLGDPAAPRSIGQPVAGHRGGVRTVAFSHDGTMLATGGDDSTTRLWNISAASGLVTTGRFARQTGNVTSVAFSPDDRTIATAGTGWAVRLWSTGGRGALELLGQPLIGHQNAVYGIAFSPDGTTLASASNDKTVRIWSVATHSVQAVLPHPQTVQAVTFLNSSNEVASVGNDGALRVWHLPGRRLDADAGPLISVVADSAGHVLATGGLDGSVHLWNITNPQKPTLIGVLPAEADSAVQHMAVSPDGRLLAVPYEDGRFEIWDITDPAHPTLAGAVPDADIGGTFTVAFDPTSQILATGGPDKLVRLWDISDTRHPHAIGKPLAGRPGAVFSLAFSPDGRTLAAGGADSIVWLYDVTNPAAPIQLGEPLGGHRGTVLGVAFDPDAPILATAGEDGLVWIWDITDIRHPVDKDGRRPYENAGVPVLSVSFDHGGHIATANADGSTWIWNLNFTDSTPLAKLVGHDQAVYGVTYIGRGDTLATVSADATGILWRMDEASAVQAACAKVGDQLSAEEWSRYIPDRAYAPPCTSR